MFLQSAREPIIAQRYLPEVRAGDKRVILVEGEAVGALNRVPAQAMRVPMCMWAVRRRPPD